MSAGEADARLRGRHITKRDRAARIGKANGAENGSAVKAGYRVGR